VCSSDLGRSVAAATRMYLTGGATAVLEGWRESTVDIDVRFEPDSDAALTRIKDLKEKLEVNVELASPLDFLPPLEGWRDREIEESLACLAWILASRAQWIALLATRSVTLSAMVSRNLIDQAGKQLAEAAGAKSRVILFGSHARGEARPDSDVDFLVIEPVVEDRLKEWERLRRALRDFPAPVDIVVLDEARAELRAKVPGTMVHHALRDGRVLAHA